MISLRHIFATITVSLACFGAAAENLQLNGSSSYTDLGKEKFIAALYLELPSNSAAEIFASKNRKRMEIRLTSRYSKRRWVNLWMQSIAIGNSNRDFNDMAGALVEMFDTQDGGLQPGDVAAINLDPESGCSYEINGVALSTEKPAGLFKLFLNTWIGKAPPSSDFRDAILGNNIDVAVARVKLEEITPSKERIADIETWLEPEIDEAQLLAEQQAAEKAEKVKAAAAAAAAKAAEEAAKLAKAEQERLAIPTQAGLFSVEEHDPVATAIATAEQLKQQQAEAEQKIVEEQPIAGEEESEQAISVESILALKNYIRSAKKQIYKSIKYPSIALRNGYEGQVRLLVQVDRNGELLNVEAAQKSKFKSLNNAAIKAVKKAAPYDVIPDSINDEPLELSIPISFKLAEK